MTDLSCSFPGCDCHPSKGDDILRISAKGRGEPFVGRCREHYGAEIPADLAQSMAYAKRPDVQQSLSPAPQGRVFRIGVNPQSGELSVTQTAGEPLGLSFTADDRPVVPESVTAVECVSPAPTLDYDLLADAPSATGNQIVGVVHGYCERETRELDSRKDGDKWKLSIADGRGGFTTWTRETPLEAWTAAATDLGLLGSPAPTEGPDDA